MREHLKKVHLLAANHHVHKSKHHAEVATQYAALTKFHKAQMDGSDNEDETHPAHVFAKLAAAHNATSSHHTKEADFHVSCAKTLHDGVSRKAAMGGDFDGLEPLPAGLSTLTPTIPSIRAVPRAGQQPLPASAENPLYAKVFGSGTDEE